MKWIVIVFSALLPFVILPQVVAQQYPSVFWEVSGNGLEKPSYLYGTIHTADNRAFQFKDGVLDAFQHADTYAMELNPDSVMNMDMLKLFIMEDNYTIKGLLGEEDYATASAFFKDSLGQSLFLYNKMQPMFVAAMIPQRVLKAEQEQPLDLYFNALAKEHHLKVVGLEKMEEQAAAFKAIPYKKQAQNLMESITASGTVDSIMYYMIEHYAQGNLDGLLALVEADPISDNFNDVFVVQRNHRMVQRLIPHLQAGSTFVAVGAAHLPGKEGIIELLRQQGYTVTAR